MSTIIFLVLYLQLLAVFFSVATAEEEQRLVEFKQQIQPEKTLENEGGDENLDELPNIIIVLLDDVGFNDLGFASDSEEMKEIRRAAPGIRSRHRDIVPPFYKKLLHKDQAIALTSYYTQSLCTPSRASLLTGKLPIHHGLNHVLIPGTPAGLSPDIKILPEYLRDLGYDNVAAGKWHLGNSQHKMTPIRRGFDSFTGIYGWDTNYYTKAIFQEPWEEIYLDWVTQSKHGNGTKDTYFQEPRHSMHAITDVALREINGRANNINKNSERPLFLYLPFTAAHAPLQGDDKVDSKECNSITETWRKQFCRLIYSIDSSLEKVTSGIEANMTDRDTVMIIISDNGGSVWNGGNNFPLRGCKGATFEGGIKVQALIVEFPKHEPNSTANALAETLNWSTESESSSSFQFERRAEYSPTFHVSDWLPTILGILGVERNVDLLDGIDHHCNLPWATTKFKKNCKKNTDGKSKYFDYRELLLEYLNPFENVFSDYVLAFRKNEMKLVEGNFPDGFWYTPSSTGFVDFSFRGVESNDFNGITMKLKKLLQFLCVRLYECVICCLEKYYGQGETDTSRTLLQSTLLYNSFKYFGLSTRDGFPTTHFFQQRGNSSNNVTVSSKVWLFNLTEDPNETRNLAEQLPLLVKQMRNRANAIAATRIPQQKVWMQVELNHYKKHMLLPGSNCKTSDKCMFVGPFISDDVKEPFETDFLVHALQDGREKTKLVIQRLRNTLVVILLLTTGALAAYIIRKRYYSSSALPVPVPLHLLLTNYARFYFSYLQAIYARLPEIAPRLLQFVRSVPVLNQIYEYISLRYSNRLFRVFTNRTTSDSAISSTLTDTSDGRTPLSDGTPSLEVSDRDSSSMRSPNSNNSAGSRSTGSSNSNNESMHSVSQKEFVSPHPPNSHVPSPTNLTPKTKQFVSPKTR